MSKKGFVKHTIEIDIPAGRDPLSYLKDALEDAIQHNYEMVMLDLTKRPHINENLMRVAAEIYRKNIEEYKQTKGTLSVIV